MPSSQIPKSRQKTARKVDPGVRSDFIVTMGYFKLDFVVVEDQAVTRQKTDAMAGIKCLDSESDPVYSTDRESMNNYLHKDKFWIINAPHDKGYLKGVLPVECKVAHLRLSP